MRIVLLLLAAASLLALIMQNKVSAHELNADESKLMAAMATAADGMVGFSAQAHCPDGVRTAAKTKSITHTHDDSGGVEIVINKAWRSTCATNGSDSQSSSAQEDRQSPAD